MSIELISIYQHHTDNKPIVRIKINGVYQEVGRSGLIYTSQRNMPSDMTSHDEARWMDLLGSRLQMFSYVLPWYYSYRFSTVSYLYPL